MMTLEPHKHIEFATVEQTFSADGGVVATVVIYTDLELSDMHPAHDAKAVAELVDHIQTWQRENGRPVTLRRTR